MTNKPPKSTSLNSNPNLQSVNPEAFEKAREMIAMVSELQDTPVAEDQVSREQFLKTIAEIQAKVDELTAMFAVRH